MLRRNPAIWGTKEIPVLCTSEEKILFESNQVNGIQLWFNRVPGRRHWKKTMITV